jgi:hypothetical protein
MENHNGAGQQVRIETTARIVQLSPDGTNHEIRIQLLGYFPEGIRVIAEANLRTFEGLDLLRALAGQVPGATQALVARVSSGILMPVK